MTGEALSLPLPKCRPASLGGPSAPGGGQGRRRRLQLHHGPVRCADGKAPTLVDFVDVDSANGPTTRPSTAGRCPGSIAARAPSCWLSNAPLPSATCSFFVTDNEVELFRKLTPGGQVEAHVTMAWTPTTSAPTRAAQPFAAGEQGGGVHRRNGLLAQCRCRDLVLYRTCCRPCASSTPALRFYIVGRSPTPPSRPWPVRPSS